MDLKVTQEPIENRQIAVTVEVEQAHVDKELKKAAKKVARQYQFPGFRKGKAPYSIVVQYAGKEALYAEFVDDLGQDIYKQVLEDEDIEPYAMATLTDVKYDPLRYILHGPLEPEIDLGEYRSLRVELEVPEVTEEQIEERLESYQKEYADWEEVDRPSEYGNLMNIDVRSVLTDAEEGEEETVVLDETDWEVTPDLENPTDPPGFDEALTGMKPGEEKEFTLGWPEDGQSIYAGREATFNVKVNSIQAYENAELNDELAQTIGPDFDTVDDLRANVRETMEEAAKNQAEAEYLEKTFDEILEMAELDYPPVVVEDQLDSMMNEFAGQLRRYGIEDFDSYLQSVGQTQEELREEQRESATRIAERNLILSELIQVEGLIAEDEDIEKQIRLMLGEEDEDGAEEADAEESAEEESVQEDDGEDSNEDAADSAADGEDADDGDYDDDEDDDDFDPEAAYRENMRNMFSEGAGRQMIESQVLNQKATDRLLAIARGEDLPEPTPLPKKEKKDESDEKDGEDDAVAASAEESDGGDAAAEEAVVEA